MNPRHQLRGRLLLVPLEKRDLVVITGSLDRQVAEPAVSVDGASGLNGFLNERHQAFRRRVRDATHANPPDPWPVLLRGNDNQCLAPRVAPARALIYAGREGLVYFDSARQPVASRPDHRATQLVQPSPGGLVAP